MKTRKKVFASFLCSIYILSSVFSSYTTAYATAIPVTYTAFEVLEMIFLSLGITVQSLELDIGDETIGNAIVDEATSFFESWMALNGFDDPEQTAEDFMTIIETGKDGVVTISNDLWQALKGWVASIGISDNDDAYLINLDKMTNCGSDNSLMLSYKLNELLESSSILIFNGSSLVDDVGNPCTMRFYSTLRTSDASSLSWIYSSWYGCWALCSSGYSDVWYYRTIKYSETSKFNYYLTCSQLASYIHRETLGEQYEMPVDDYIFIPKGTTLSEALAPDVYFPEQSLSYDFCYLPNIDVESMLENDTYDVITPGRTWNGTDVAGDVTLTYPEDLAADIPFQDWYDDVVAGDIPFDDALTGIGAIAVDTDADAVLEGEGSISDAIIDSTIGNAPSIDDTKEDVSEDGETVISNVPMTFDLSKLFPFCIPFDIIDFLAVLSAPPEAPCFVWPIQYPTASGMETYELEIDLSQFDEVAELLRTMETLVFIIGLAGITRNHMIRG